MFKKAAIVGVGLIGASLGKAIKKFKLAKEVIGIGHHKSSISQALKINAIDKGSLDLKDIEGADLVIFATPVNTIIELAFKANKFLSKNTLVIDAGSTKEGIVKAFNRAFSKNVQFVGCHPLAGLEKKGPLFSNGGMFKNSVTVLTPLASRITEENLEKIKIFWRKLGSCVVAMPAHSHDKMIAYISNLPHLLAFSLLESVPVNFLKFSAAGFKDTTRIGASDPLIWNDIFISNQKEVLSALGIWQKKINKLKSLIKNKNKTNLKRYILSAKLKRESIK